METMKNTWRFLVLAALTAAPLGFSCGQPHPFLTERVVTSTVALQGETTLHVDSAVPIRIQGEPRIDEVFATLEVALTASTAATADRLAEEAEVLVDRSESGVLKLTLPAPDHASIRGGLGIRAPNDLNVVVIERAGTVQIENIEGDIIVNARSHVLITGAENNVTVRAEQGNAIVSTRLPPGTTTDILVGAGDVQLTVPTGLSADIEANAPSGQVITSHPNLPRALNTRLPYEANVGGGLSIVRLATRQGVILIQNQP